MSKSWLRVGIVIAAWAFLGLTAVPSESQTSAPAGSGTFRFLRTIRFHIPVVDCHDLAGSFDCVETSTVPESFDLGAATSTLDVAMTLTVTYRTTRHDPVSIIATMRPVVEDRLMLPGRLPLRPSTITTTTTLRWTAEDVPPDVYRLGFQIEYGAAARLPLKIWAPKITVLLEAWQGGAP